MQTKIPVTPPRLGKVQKQTITNVRETMSLETANRRGKWHNPFEKQFGITWQSWGWTQATPLQQFHPWTTALKKPVCLWTKHLGRVSRTECWQTPATTVQCIVALSCRSKQAIYGDSHQNNSGLRGWALTERGQEETCWGDENDLYLNQCWLHKWMHLSNSLNYTLRCV